MEILKQHNVELSEELRKSQKYVVSNNNNDTNYLPYIIMVLLTCILHI